MSDKSQTLANHQMFRPLLHFSTLPIFLVNAIVWIVQAVKQPGLMSAWMAVVMLSLFLFVFDNRNSVLTIQDRVIRDEMRLRLERVLGGGAKDKIAKLRVEHLIGLRFASDAELPALVDRTIAGEFANRKAVKSAVKDWQADRLRA
jgi:hypothetical protein